MWLQTIVGKVVGWAAADVARPAAACRRALVCCKLRRPSGSAAGQASPCGKLRPPNGSEAARTLPPTLVRRPSVCGVCRRLRTLPCAGQSVASLRHLTGCEHNDWCDGWLSAMRRPRTRPLPRPTSPPCSHLLLCIEACARRRRGGRRAQLCARQPWPPLEHTRVAAQCAACMPTGAASTPHGRGTRAHANHTVGGDGGIA